MSFNRNSPDLLAGQGCFSSKRPNDLAVAVETSRASVVAVLDFPPSALDGLLAFTVALGLFQASAFAGRQTA
jgi:hypothetical protein